MKLSAALLAASLGVAAAHGDHGQHVPKLVGGRRFLSDMKMRQAATPHQPIVDRKSRRSTKPPGSLQERQLGGISGQCGPGYGSCAQGYCCSPEGWCGKGLDYCSAPDCQLNYGTGCDGNKKPTGTDTSTVPRPKLGKVLYGGAGIYDCVNDGDIAVTFDDGPYIYTNDLLDKLKSYGAKATFFMTGNNLGKGMINDPTSIYPAIIRRMHAEGHQIASHTWSHQNASQLTNAQFTNQMIWNEIAINSILGFFPTYMRPPYSICERGCQTILSSLGYHAVYFDLDTEGYLNDDAKLIQNSKNIWDQAMRTSKPSTDSFLQIEHDIHYQTVYNLTDYVLTSLFSHGYRSVTVGECLGDPAANWYRAGPDDTVLVPGGTGPTTSPAPTRTTVSIRTTISTRSTIPFPSTTGRSTVQPTTKPTQPTQPTQPTRTYISILPTGTGASTDGTCGAGVTCKGSRWGSCCSNFGYCGVGDDFCSLDNGCQPAFGTCSDSPPSQPSSPPSSPAAGGLPISVDGSCGQDNGQSCAGSTFGACCGPDDTCATTTIACLSILGCQQGFGYCI